MTWTDPKTREDFARHAALAALLSVQGNRQPVLDYLTRLAASAQGPLAARFVTVFAALRGQLLGQGLARYAVALAPPPDILTDWNASPRIDYAIEPLDPWLQSLFVAHGVKPLNIAVAIDEDGLGAMSDWIDTPGLAWRVFTIARVPFHQQPASLAATVLDAAAEALDAAKAALSLSDSLWASPSTKNASHG